jgi:hypothetical protein
MHRRPSCNSVAYGYRLDTLEAQQAFLLACLAP